MQSPIGVRRVVLVVLDGLRPDMIDGGRLTHIQELAYAGAWTNRAEPAWSAGDASRFRDSMDRLSSELGVAGTRFIGRDAEFCLHIAQPTLVMQRRGLIVMHWPDAERAANDFGRTSRRYEAAAKQLDEAVASLAVQLQMPRDPSTMLIVVTDHVRSTDDLPLRALTNERELLVIAGGAVVAAPLPKTVSVVDLAPTIRWALGIGAEGPGVLRRAFRQVRDDRVATAEELRDASPSM